MIKASPVTLVSPNNLPSSLRALVYYTSYEL